MHIGLARCLQSVVHIVQLLAALVEAILTISHVALLDEGPRGLPCAIGEREVTTIGPRHVECLAILLIGEHIHMATLLYLSIGKIGIGGLVDYHIVCLVTGARNVVAVALLLVAHAQAAVGSGEHVRLVRNRGGVVAIGEARGTGLCVAGHTIHEERIGLHVVDIHDVGRFQRSEVLTRHSRSGPHLCLHCQGSHQAPT